MTRALALGSVLVVANGDFGREVLGVGRRLPGSSSGGPSSGDDSGGDDGEWCDMCGASTTYAETIDTSGTYAKRTVETNGCPNHYNVCTGKDGTETSAGDEEPGGAGDAEEGRGVRRAERRRRERRARPARCG